MPTDAPNERARRCRRKATKYGRRREQPGASATPDAEIAALLAKLAVPIARITSDSRQVRRGDAFAAFRGAHQDGRGFIADAIARGAGAILWDVQGFSWNRDWKLPHVPVEA